MHNRRNAARHIHRGMVQQLPVGNDEVGMRGVMVYRPSLFGLYLALAADNSSVCETEFGSRIVQML